MALCDPDFQGKMAFGVLGPVSVSAARRRLEAGAAKAPHGRRGQVSFGKFRVKVLHFMRTSPRVSLSCAGIVLVSSTVVWALVASKFLI